MFELKPVDAAEERLKHERKHRSLVDLVEECVLVQKQSRLALTLACMAGMAILLLCAITLVTTARMCS